MEGFNCDDLEKAVFEVYGSKIRSISLYPPECQQRIKAYYRFNGDRYLTKNLPRQYNAFGMRS